METNYIVRDIDAELLKWKDNPRRKSLLIRGARQVGKSSSVRHLALSFENFVEVNFERSPEAKTFFDSELNPKAICENLSILLDKPITPGQTLLFFDEIQSCPRAIQSLRYFYEDYPEQHIVAAGSLLEFALESLPSFGVGRIHSMYMYPFSFPEFLRACDAAPLWNLICQSSSARPLPAPLHNKANDYLRKFLAIGGMPAVIQAYLQTGSVRESMLVLDDLIENLRSDFAKYKQRVPEMRIATVFDALAHQSGNKLIVSKLSNEYNSRQLKEGLDLLIKSGLVFPVFHTNANGIPLGAGVDLKRQKVFFIDTGIYQRVLGLQLSDILFEAEAEFVNKGAIAEMYVGLEIIKACSMNGMRDLYYWHREATNSHAEVDYVVQLNDKIVPIEVKSGHSGKMHSLHLFMQEKKSDLGIRTSLENFSTYEKIDVVPLYAIANRVVVR